MKIPELPAIYKSAAEPNSTEVKNLANSAKDTSGGRTVGIILTALGLAGAAGYAGYKFWPKASKFAKNKIKEYKIKAGADNPESTISAVPEPNKIKEYVAETLAGAIPAWVGVSAAIPPADKAVEALYHARNFIDDAAAGVRFWYKHRGKVKASKVMQTLLRGSKLSTGFNPLWRVSRGNALLLALETALTPTTMGDAELRPPRTPEEEAEVRLGWVHPLQVHKKTKLGEEAERWMSKYRAHRLTPQDSPTLPMRPEVPQFGDEPMVEVGEYSPGVPIVLPIDAFADKGVVRLPPNAKIR